MAATAGGFVVHGDTPAVHAAAELLADGNPRDADTNTATTQSPTTLQRLEELRRQSAAGRSDARTTATANPPPAPAGPPPIVGTFQAVPGCAATVPETEPPNGRLADDQLCPIGPDGHRLRADAAAAYLAMNDAYAAAFGEPICISDSYRSLGAQQSLYWRKPGLAAQPGTSNHGWGVAVDLFCGVESHGSAQHAWLAEHGDDYGWINPDWARPGGSRPEPWHWEFDPTLLD